MTPRNLHEVFALLKHAARTAAPPLQPPPPKIDSVLRNIASSRASRPIKPRPESIPKWVNAIRQSDYSGITPADIRSLIWERDIVLTLNFIEHLFERQFSVRRSAIKGFIFALASRWNEVEAGDLQLPQFEHALSQLSKSDFLNTVRPFILHSMGHIAFADLVTQRKSSVNDVFGEIFGLVLPTTPYTSSVLRVVSQKARAAALSPNRGEREWFYNSVLVLLPKADLLPCLGLIVKEIERLDAQEPKEELKGFILTHPNLGDPRLPGFEGNWVKDDPVTQSVIEWLSQSDISFFFELFFEDRRDYQGRKQFWLRYAHRIRGTRVVISTPDRTRLRRQLLDLDPKKVNKKMFGHLMSSGQMPTAFMMDFGDFWVVEFSLPGHACYFYNKASSFKFSNRTAFWDTEVFSVTDLKNRARCTDRLSHNDKWESKFSALLAANGIRSKLNRSYG